MKDWFVSALWSDGDVTTVSYPEEDTETLQDALRRMARWLDDHMYKGMVGPRVVGVWIYGKKR